MKQVGKKWNYTFWMIVVVITVNNYLIKPLIFDSLNAPASISNLENKLFEEREDR